MKETTMGTLVLKDEPITTTTKLSETIERVSFGPSCLDMGWQWEVEPVSAAGWRIRCSFQRPDTNTGTIGRGFGRWWLVDRGVTESGLWKTMYAAAKMILEHELLEAFKVDGVRPFDPHRTIQSLIAVDEDAPTVITAG
jgi:hypothetical protein